MNNDDPSNNVKIPKKIHFIWYGNKMPWTITSYIEMTKRKYPDFKVRIWGMKDFDPRKVEYTKQAYKQKKWAFISDYLRVKILYDEGGIYLDTDMVPIGDLRPLLTNSIVLGWEYNKLITTGFCASVPKHPLFKKILETYDSITAQNDKEFKFLVNNELWTYILKSNYNLELNGKIQHLIGDILVHPQSFFSEAKISDDSIFLHDHQLSWTTTKKQKIMIVSLYLVRKFQNWLKPFLSIATYIQFRSNKKAVANMEEEILNENTKRIKK